MVKKNNKVAKTCKIILRLLTCTLDGALAGAVVRSVIRPRRCEEPTPAGRYKHNIRDQFSKLSKML